MTSYHFKNKSKLINQDIQHIYYLILSKEYYGWTKSYFNRIFYNKIKVVNDCFYIKWRNRICC